MLKGSNEASSLPVSLSSATDLIEGRVNATATNKVHGGGGGLALTTALSHFPELEPEVELLGYGCNADLTKGQLDAHWTQTHQASESLSLRIPPSLVCNSPDGTGGE
jgi:hypothetical protein